MKLAEYGCMYYTQKLTYIYITAYMLIYYNILLDWFESLVDCSAYNFTNTKDMPWVLYNAIYIILGIQTMIVDKAPAGALWHWSYV